MKSLTIVAILLMLCVSAWADDAHGPAASTMPGGAHSKLPAAKMPVMPVMPPSLETGSLAIKVVQGTKDGPKVGADQVIVELYGQGGMIYSTETKLDVHGVTMIENLPLGVPFRPRVSVNHGGEFYTTDGAEMGPDNPTQHLTVTVFETSDQAPKLEVAMWHLILQPVEGGGLQVVERYSIRNESDSAYLGAMDPNGNRVAVTLTLPEGVTNVKMGGDLDEKYASITGRRLTSSSSIRPGLSKLLLNYVIPTPGRQARVNLVAPGVVKQLMVFVPHDIEGFQGDNFQAGEVYNVHDKPMRAYMIANIAPGQELSFTLGDLPGPVLKTSYVPHMLAAFGGAILLVCCIVALLRRKSEDQPEVV